MRQRPASRRRRSATRLPGVCLLLALAGLLSGCEVVRSLAYVVGGEPETKSNVKAMYHGLENKSLAVLVAASENTMFEYPEATSALCRSVTAKLAGLPGVKPVNPDQVIQFQRENPYWNTVPYADLIRRLHVDRLLIIDLAQYSLHDPGDQFVWRGQIIAGVGVVEAEKESSNFAFNHTVGAVYPPATLVGVVNSDDNTIRYGLLDAFSKHVFHLFQDYTEITK